MVRSVMGSIIFYQLMMCAIILAFNLYSLELNGISTNLEVFASIYEILFSVTPTFAYCFLSNRVTSRLLEVGDAFYGCAWYALAPDQQMLFFAIIQRSQRDMCFSGLGIIECTLESFSSVMLLRLHELAVHFYLPRTFFSYKTCIIFLSFPFHVIFTRPFTDNPYGLLILSSHS